MQVHARLVFFVVLVAAFVTCLVVGDLIGGRLYGFEVGGLELAVSAGMIPFPVTFLLTDLINEYYGKRLARVVTWIGLGMATLTLGLVLAAGALPSAPFTAISDACYSDVFTDSVRIFGASLGAYLIAQLTDIAVFHRLKRLTANRLLWLRATGSTAVSQLVDTVVIQSLAWVGTPQESLIPKLILTSYLVKLVVAVGLTPLVYAGHALVGRALGMQPVVLGPDGEPVADPDAAAGVGASRDRSG
jgi:uncharacterized integral membrane protein (TIGR00697 family)